MKKQVYLFTASYPYGNSERAFLQEEIKALADAFDEIIILPLCPKGKLINKLPKNVSIYPFSELSSPNPLQTVWLSLLL
ncbi:MAG: hypothetical protein D3909_19195, partial [Candidatus Electrothrix sp. ATG1]|nr:hypothetical protein [Candidatus Electrothrix sp. ATG1]